MVESNAEVARRARDLMVRGYHWAEAVTLAVGEHVLTTFDRSMVKIASPFAGGVGGTEKEMCGALSGGVIVIGALHGRCEADADDQAAELAAVRYRERFAEEFGTTRCGPIYSKVHAPGGLGSCSYVGERASLILLEVLEEGSQRMPSAKPGQAGRSGG